MRTVCLLGLVAAAAAAAAAASAPASNAAPKPFIPLLANKGKLLVHDEPVALAAGPASMAGQGTAAGTDDLAAAAVDYLAATYGAPADSMRVTAAYTDAASGITHVHVVQRVRGADVANAVANVNISRDRRVISSAQSFAAPAALAEAGGASGAGGAHQMGEASDILAQARRALGVLAQHLGTPLDAAEQAGIGAAVEASGSDGQPVVVALDGVPARVAAAGAATASPAFVQLGDGRVAAAWRVTAEQDSHWWNAYVAADEARVVALADWYAQAAEGYVVFPRDVNSPADGARRLVADPALGAASPDGWAAGGTTGGNNVWAQSNPTGGSGWRDNHRPRAGPGGVFNATLDLRQAPTAYVDAAITQLFYTANAMHDLAFVYGFDEAAGNFQDENYSGAGAGGDAVIANAQDGSGTNNANFATPPDGQRPRMRMYVWTMTRPARDGDLEQDIVVHEYTHGISNRLTGGPANSDCLVSGESGGMGEGWSDAVANIVRLRPGATRATQMAMGEYAAGRNIRTYPYATSLAANPLTYGYLDRADYQEVHAIGEVWAAMLYEVTWALIDAHGLAPDLLAHDTAKGNALALQLLLDGMKLQPCNPSFTDARDAILQADANLTGGRNRCVLWAAFAKRGLGAGASGGDGQRHVEDFKVPSGC
ncbi:hypothetical protein H4R18_005508 [Coemansia javaensis]|uniref:Extracellular metalloproteinase n=1 Tax=Coemansia javaensis TaxID=2761396 RepID=A0A9W8H635_9FUNG|nr:hypothetical protein H4R18_005508 [Coemansia javaensis]